MLKIHSRHTCFRDLRNLTFHGACFRTNLEYAVAFGTSSAPLPFSSSPKHKNFAAPLCMLRSLLHAAVARENLYV